MNRRPAQSIATWLARTGSRLVRRAALFAWAAAGIHVSAQAQLSEVPAPAPVAAVDSAIEQQIRQMATSSIHTDARPGAKAAPRIEVSIGQLDPRLRLAPCSHIEPYLAEGTRLWGKSRIGLRCTQGAVKWNVYLPITVKVFGTALVAANGISAGTVLAAADLASAEVDLAEDNSAVVTNTDMAVGRTLARPLKPGQSLRQTHLKARQWFAAGETVTVVAQGDGFSVAGEAQALNNGVEGQVVRVRMESGRVLTGQPVGERRVELAL